MTNYYRIFYLHFRKIILLYKQSELRYTTLSNININKKLIIWFLNFQFFAVYL